MFIDAATVHERLDNNTALESQIYEDPADAAVSDQLEKAYREQGRSEELLQLLLARAENVATIAERVAILRQASEVCSSTGDLSSALMILLTAFDQDRGNREIADELDQLAHHTGQWDEVLDAYLLAAARLDDAVQAGDLWLRMACTHAFVTGDSEQLSAALEHVHSVSDGWAQSYLDLVERQMNTAELLGTLAEMCMRIGDTQRRARCLARCIAKNDSIVEKASIHAELASLHLGSDDTVAANWHLREAMRLDPKRTDCQAALIALNKEEGNYREAAELLRSQALGSQANRSDAAFEAAQLYSDLDENTQCFDLLSVALKEDPHHLGAAMPLADRYYEDKRWSELEPLLDLLLANRNNLPAASESMSELLYRAGKCAYELDNKAKAQDLLSRARTLDPESRAILRLLADVLADSSDLHAAYDANQQLLATQQEGPQKHSTQTHMRMAKIRRQQRMVEDAEFHAGQAYGLEPGNIEAGRLFSEILEELEKFREAVKVRRELLSYGDLEEKVRLHAEIANLQCWKLDDPMGAIKEYEQALERQPDNRKVMHSLLDLYSAVEMWKDAIDVILKIADVEEDPLRRGKYHDAAGAIIREQLGDTRAVHCFNMALDCFFVDVKELPERLRAGCLRPFHRIVEFLHEKQDYEQLERSYRKMIQRLSKDDPQVLHLWQELGHLYKSKLDRPEDAIASYEVVSALDAGSNHKRVLLGLYEQSEAQVDKAIEQRIAMTKDDPFSAEHYSALTEIYLRLGQPDRAWCATRVLVFLDKATEAQKSFYYQHQHREMRWPRTPFSAHMWNEIRHPDENLLVSNILALVADVMLADCAVDETDLHGRDGQTPLHDELRGLVSGVAYAMGMPAARVTVDLDVTADMLFLPTLHGPAFVVGRGIWEAPTMRARAHAAAVVLAHGRPTAQLRQLSESPEHLDAVLLGVMSFVRPDLSVPHAMAPRIAHVHQVLKKRLAQPRKVRLAHAVHALIASGVRHDMSGWWHAVDCTSQRVALALSGDLQVGVAIAHRESKGAHEVVADLVRFSISPVLGAMRRDLDIANCASS
ncbi:MAG: hypothetical protein GY811_19420 [Myxococcales bacterium]|nr:hypothetical protein [Myxococcales bacterium]